MDKLLNILFQVFQYSILGVCALMGVGAIFFILFLIWNYSEERATADYKSAKKYHIFLRAINYLGIAAFAFMIFAAITLKIDRLIGWAEHGGKSSSLVVLIVLASAGFYMYESRFGKWLRSPIDENKNINSSGDDDQNAA